MLIGIVLMLTLSGVYAEDIDVDSSSVTESPISVGVEQSLSSGDAFNNDLSNIYEPSDSSNLYESYDSYGYYESSDVPQFNNEIGYTQDNYVELAYVDSVGVDYYIDSYESVDVPVVDVDCEYYVCEHNYDDFIDVSLTDGDIDCVNCDYRTLKMPVIDTDENGEINSIIDDNIVLNNSNSCNEINIPISTKEILGQCDELDVNLVDTIMSEVTNDMETSESYKLIRNVTQFDNLHNFESDDAILAINVAGVPKGDASEPVFDGSLKVSEYISDIEEVYFGTLSQKDSDKLLEAVGSDNMLLFAGIANWYSEVTLSMLQNLSNHGQVCEENFECYTVTKALLQYCPLTNEMYICKVCGNEDEHDYVINDTNSHGLDYAYSKHVNVIYKDMPNLKVLTSYGFVSIEKQVSVGVWDSLNDVLGIGISSKTLLPDHKAIWTPLLLLKQQDSKESIINSHTGDNKNKTKINATNNTDDNNTNESNSSKKIPHHGGKHHYYHKNWGSNWNSYNYCQYSAVNVVPEKVGLNKLDNVTKNSTKNNTNSSSNMTAAFKGKSGGYPKANLKGGETTYTLIYAILGIAVLGILFNSTYMKRDD